MTKDEALDLALEALEKSVATCFDRYAHEQVMSRPEHFINQAITAIKQARSAPVQEPASWMEMVVANLVREGVNKHKARELAEHFYTTPPAAQPAPVQPVGTYGEIFSAMWLLLRSGTQRDQQIYEEMKDKPLYTTPPAAQPAVPDAIHHTDLSETLEYINGWNDCRAETNRRANASWSLMCEKMVAAEREACAKVCDAVAQQMDDEGEGPTGNIGWVIGCADAIRARGNI